MAQHDYFIADQNGLNFLADLNSALAAVASSNSGGVAPANPQPFMPWADTAGDLLKIRNAANSAWIPLMVLSTGVAVGNVAQTSSTGSAKLPAGTTAQRDGSPGVGWTRFNSTLGKNETWNGTAWASSIDSASPVFTGVLTTDQRINVSASYGALQVNGADVLRFGSDSSGQLAGFRNVIINGNFQVNQREYVSGAEVGAGLYGHDRWKMAASADTYTYSTVNNKTTVTIPAGKVLQQVIEGLNLQSGTYTLSWQGTAQGKIGAGAYGASGVTGSAVGGTDITIEFGPGTVSRVQLEFGSLASVFENRPIGLELSLCQRYYETGSFSFAGYSSAGSGYGQKRTFAVTKRTAPTMSTSGVGTMNVSGIGLGGHTDGFFSTAYITATGVGSYSGTYAASAEL